jgi:uncharacterized protein (TIGR02271 family)
LIPGFGPAIAGGILAATLGGAAIGAAAGGLLGALTGMGVPEEEARYYESEFQAGRIILTVQADGRRDEAINILRRYGAYDAASRGDQMTPYGGTGAGYDTGTTTTSTTSTTTSGTGGAAIYGGTARQDEGAERIELREEEIVPVKQARQAGEVQLQKTVREEEREVPVNLRHEEVSIERHAVNRPLEGGEIGDLQDEVINVPIYEERAELQKQGRVAEEVVINKDVAEDQQTLRGTVRREDVEIERTGDARIQGDVNTREGYTNDAQRGYDTDAQSRP